MPKAEVIKLFSATFVDLRTTHSAFSLILASSTAILYSESLIIPGRYATHGRETQDAQQELDDWY